MTKLLVLAVIVIVVWYGFKWAGRVNQRRGVGQVTDRDGGKAKPEDAQDMAKCDICGTFVPAEGARNCGRDGCPYGG